MELVISPIAGAIGGIGGQLLYTLGAGGVADAAGVAGGMDIGAIGGQIASGGVGGGAQLAVVSVIKYAMGK